MHASNETPAPVAAFQKILKGELALKEFDLKRLLHVPPKGNQHIRAQIFAALHRRRFVDHCGEIARGRRTKVTPILRLRLFAQRAESGDKAHGEITPPRESRRQAASRLRGAELQKPVAGPLLEARLEPFSQPVFERKFVFGAIEAERAMRRQVLA